MQQHWPRNSSFRGALTSPGSASVYEQQVLVHLHLVAGSGAPELTLKCRFTSSVDAQNDGVMYPCQPCRRDCKIPYRIAAAAVETFSDSIWPRIGSEINWSQWSATRGRSPFPSEPRTSTTRPL